MGGFLAQPAVLYPHLFSKDGLFGRYPYLLPNLVAAIGIVLAIIQGMLFLKETLVREEKTEGSTNGHQDAYNVNERSRLLPSHAHASHSARGRDARGSVAGSVRERGSFVSLTRERLHSMSVAGSIRQIRKRASFMEEGMPMPFDQSFDIRRQSFGTMHSIRVPPHEVLPLRRQAPPRKTFNKTVVMLIISMAIFSFHQMAFISILPAYILDKPMAPGLDFRGGLGMSLPDVGTFLAVNGFIALFVQGFVFPIFVEHVGVWTSFFWMVLLYPICYLPMPFLSAVPNGLITPGVYLMLCTQSFFNIVVFPCALILLKNATPSPLVLGRVNGMAMSACCLARTFACPLVGIFYSLGGSAAAWASLFLMTVFGLIQLIWIPKEEVGPVEIDNGLKRVIHIEEDDNAVDDISVIESVR
jgi:hypothetical protein